VSGLRVALVGGPMYDRLYELLPADVEIVVHADHPTLNREVAARLARGERIDVLSTHGKYAPSQSDWLLPLDDLVAADALHELAPRPIDLCRFEGALLCVPRCIDVRVLWWRTDLLDCPPRTWEDVEAAPGAFGFTGRESGLFGLFFELVAGAGGSLFDEALRPQLATPEGVAAVERLQRLAAQAPDDLPTWHYDEVDDALLGGRVAMAAAWPGGTDRIRHSELADRLAPARYPGGWSYSGCHGWAIPRTCGDVPAAVALVERFAGASAGAADAASGTIPANRVALAGHEPVDDVDAERLAITAATIDDGMLTYPPLRRFPEVEDAGWGAIHDALRGARSAADAVAAMQVAAEAALS
jgi:multiple sugar transport system substrate-binding protein